MTIEAAEFDAALAAASGDDLALAAELRAVFSESAEHHLDLMRRARCDGNWRVAASRLRGLAATFHATPLIVLAEEALDGVPGEPGVLRRLQACVTALGSRGD